MEINKKEFVHQDVEICKLCGKDVITKVQGWVVMVDYVGENHIQTGIYHKECLNDLIKGQGKVIQDKFKNYLIETLGKVFKNMKPEGNQVYELKH